MKASEAQQIEREWLNQWSLAPVDNAWQVGRNWAEPAKARPVRRTPWPYIIGSVLAFASLALIIYPL